MVLGLLAWGGEATPYELKQIVAGGIGQFWSIPHSQVYSEPERLTAAGHLRERREQKGRRRKHYSLTAKGRKALEAWLETPTEELYELRDPGLLKLALGAEPGKLAELQLAAHKRRLELIESLRAPAPGGDVPLGPWLVAEAGIGHEREYIRFWSRVARKHA
jgi:DNA-binding PadR family transcriptional regulator